MQWNKCVRYILLVACVLTVAFIFSNSLQDADLSSSSSGAVGDAVEDVTNGIISGGTISRGDEGFVEIPDYIIRNTAHVLEFALLGCLVTLTSRAYGMRLSRVYIPMLICISVAIVDEILQIHVPGRAFELTDALLDSLGAGVGLGLAIVVGYVILRDAPKAMIDKTCSISIGDGREGYDERE